MISAMRFRAVSRLSQQLRLSQRKLASTGRQLDTTAITTSPKETLEASEQPTEVVQAPNREGIWARSQKPRSKAMVGPRFEQTDFSLQVSGAQIRDSCQGDGRTDGWMNGLIANGSNNY